MPDYEFIKSVLQQASVQGSRSTILYPLHWIIAKLIAAIFIVYYFKFPEWIGITSVILLIVFVVIYIFIYLYFAFKDRDVLRSEKFKIQKLAIEKGVFGDNLVGILNVKELMNLESGLKIEDKGNIGDSK